MEEKDRKDMEREEDKVRSGRLGRRRRWVVPVLLVVTFSAGMIAGASIAVLGIRHFVQQSLIHPEERVHAIATRMQRRLDLTDEQRREVEGIFRKRNEALQAIRREVRPRVIAEMDGAYQEVAALLNEEQGRKWKGMYERVRERVPPALPEGNDDE